MPSVADVCLKVEVKVLVLAVDDRGKVKLSMRAVNQETGEEVPVERVGRGSLAANVGHITMDDDVHPKFCFDV